MNKCMILGNVTRDLELRKTTTNKSVTEFTIAVNEGYGDKKTTEYINCVAWEKNAETLSNYLKKGNKILVEGRLHTDTYEKDGKKLYKTYVIVYSFEFIGGNKEDKPKDDLTKDDLIATQKVDISSDELPFY